MKHIVFSILILLSFPLLAKDKDNQLTECLDQAELEMIHLQVQRLNSQFEVSNDEVKKDDRNKPLATYSCISSNS